VEGEKGEVEGGGVRIRRGGGGEVEGGGRRDKKKGRGRGGRESGEGRDRLTRKRRGVRLQKGTLRLDRYLS